MTPERRTALFVSVAAVLSWVLCRGSLMPLVLLGCLWGLAAALLVFAIRRLGLSDRWLVPLVPVFLAGMVEWAVTSVPLLYAVTGGSIVGVATTLSVVVLRDNRRHVPGFVLHMGVLVAVAALFLGIVAVDIRLIGARLPAAVFLALIYAGLGVGVALAVASQILLDRWRSNGSMFRPPEDGG